MWLEHNAPDWKVPGFNSGGDRASQVFIFSGAYIFGPINNSFQHKITFVIEFIWVVTKIAIFFKWNISVFCWNNNSICNHPLRFPKTKRIYFPPSPVCLFLFINFVLQRLILTHNFCQTCPNNFLLARFKFWRQLLVFTESEWALITRKLLLIN